MSEKRVVDKIEDGCLCANLGDKIAVVVRVPPTSQDDPEPNYDLWEGVKTEYVLCSNTCVKEHHHGTLYVYEDHTAKFICDNVKKEESNEHNEY